MLSRRILCAMLVACACTAAFAQITYPLADLNDQPHAYSYDPALYMTHLPGFELFAVDDSLHGRELWRSDGTPAGTGLVADLTPGFQWSDVKGIREFQGQAYALIGNRIYQTDGTAAGTTLFYTYEGYMGGETWVTTDTYFYGVGSDGLIRTDGTEAGTLVLAPQAYDLFVMGNLVFFRPTYNEGQLMVTDGTVEGTLALGITVTGTLVAMGGKIYCSGRTNGYDQELWCSDGTVSGTNRVADLVPGDNGSRPRNFYVTGNRLYFSAQHPDTGHEFYTTDGTEMGTLLLKDIAPGTFHAAASILGSDGTRVYLLAQTPGNEVWVTDGTPAGTLPHPSLTFTGRSDMKGLGTIQGRLIVTEQNYAHTTVYSLDATDHQVLAEFTNQLTAATKDETPLHAQTFVRNNLLYFQVFGETYDLHLWSTDATAAGTQQAVTLRHPRSNSRSANDYRLADGEDFALIWGIYADGRRTFATDGTRRHTEQLDKSPYFYFYYRGDEVFYTNNNGAYRSDGTLEGTQPLHGYNYKAYHEVDGVLRFVYGPRLYALNPDQTTIDLIADFSTYNVKSFFPQARTTTEGSWLFSYADDGFDLWFVDSDGFRKIRHFQTASDIQIFQSVGDRVVFFVADSAQPGIWQARRDEVSRIGNIWPGRSTQGDYRHVVLGDEVFFCASTPATGYELWATDGTVAGTRMVADIYEGPSHGVLGLDAVALDGYVYFPATDPDHGTELWRSDGTTSGTTLVADAVPGPEGVAPLMTVVYDDQVFFSGVTEAEGRELWASDGTAPGTRLVLDTVPGPTWGNPTSLIGLNRGLVYWPNSDTGYEPWVYRTAPSAYFESPESLCGGGSYQIIAYEDHPDAAYTWTVAGGTITSGQGSDTLTFEAGAGTTVTLTLQVDIDGQMGEHHIGIPVFSSVPASPGPINGPAEICPGDTNVAYGVDAQADATVYHWTLPPDAVLVSGAGTTDIVVDFGPVGGTVSVVAENPCGESAAAVKTVTLAVSTPAYAGPHQVVCGPETVLEASDVPNTTGLWEIVSGTGGMLVDAGDPHSAFSGVAGETYRLRWTQIHGVCGSTSDTTVIAFAPPADLADAGPDQTVCGSYGVLEGNQPSAYYGTWEVVSGSGGRFEDTHDPHSLFFGASEETYVLRWILRGKPCEETADTVQLQFLPAETVDAGPDLAVAAGAKMVLGGRGEPGTWSVESGPSTDDAQLADPASADTFFTPRGGPGIYILRRTRTTPGCTPVWDETVVEVFSGAPAPWDFGEITTFGIVGTTTSTGILLNGFYYFAASSEVYGTALYRTDGNAVTLVSDYAPGSYANRVLQWAVLGDRLFFRTTNEIWTTDGTGTGTRLLQRGSSIESTDPLVVTDQAVYAAVDARLVRYDRHGEGGFVAEPEMDRPLAAFDDRVFFFEGRTLWLGNGTATGSIPLTTLPSAAGNPTPYAFFPFEGRTYFFYGGSLYATNGTPGGTVLVKTFRASGGARSPFALPPVIFADKLFFSAASDEAGRELWSSDGTTEGTVLVHDLAPGTAYGAGDPVVVGDALYLAGEGTVAGLWRTDGTSEGFEFISPDVGPLVAVGERLFFIKNQELWTSDGTGPGTVSLDLTPGSANSNPYLVGVFNGNLYFALSNGPEDADFYRTLGATADVLPLADLHGRRLPDTPQGVVLGDILVFGAHDATHGTEPRISDDAGTRLLADLVPGIGHSNPAWFTVLADRVYFVAESATPQGTILWSTDGTTAGTHAVDIPENHGAPEQLTAFGDKLALSLYGPMGREVYLFDPADASFTLLKDVNPGTSSADPVNFKVWRDRLYFRAKAGSYRYLYYSDGTPDGTGPAPLYTDRVGDETLHVTRDAVFLKKGAELYGSRDPDTPGEVVYSSYVDGLYPLADRLLILDRSGTALHLSVSDGTPTGTRYLLGTNMPGAIQVGGTETLAMVVGGGTLLTTDGTQAGTRFLQHPHYLSSPTHLGNRTVLWQHTPATGTELVETDGTHVWRLPELIPGPAAPVLLATFHGTHRSFFVTSADVGYRVYAIAYGDVPIQDRTLLEQLRTDYDLNDDGFFDTHEAGYITHLSLPGAGIYLLDGIDYLTGLTTLDLSDNQITDPRPLIEAAIGTRAGDSVDLRGNFLDAGDCAALTVLATRADTAGATFLYHDQGGNPYYPPPWSWPDFNIRAMLGGIAVPPGSLDCPLAPLDGGDQ